MSLSNLFGNNKNKNEEDNSFLPTKEQIQTFIDQTKANLKSKSKKTYIIIGIITFVILYFMGITTTAIRFFGESGKLGIRNAPQPTLNPFSALFALFDIKYSIWALLIVLIAAAAILLWWIRNNITLGRTQMEERSGAGYKRQVHDATFGSAREMNDEEISKNYLVVSKQELEINNPKTVIFGLLPETRDFVMGRHFPKGQVENQNVFLVGDAGSRKTSNFIITLHMQLCAAGRNIVATDNSGEIFSYTYQMYKKAGYNIRVINTMDPKKSDSWNFVGSIGNDLDLAKTFSRTIVESTELPGTKSDPYFIDGMLSVLPALMVYVNQRGKGYNNISEVLRMITDYSLDDLTSLFHSLDENNEARKQFKIFERSPVRENFLSNAAERLDMFVSNDIGRICSGDGLSLVDELGQEDTKTIIYIVTNKTYAFLSALILNATVKILSQHARDTYEDLILPRGLYFVYEEFLTQGYIPNMGDTLSETRKYGFVFYLVCQAIPQFFRKYGELEAREIMESCKYKMLFGAGGPMTAEEFEKHCGPTTTRTSMVAAGDPIIRTADQVREGQQQRMLYDYNELMTFNEDEYILFSTHSHPLRLKKPYYKFVPGADSLVKDHLKNYIPKEISYIDKHCRTSQEEVSSFSELDKPISTTKQKISVPRKNDDFANSGIGTLFDAENKLSKNRPVVNDSEVSRDVRDNLVYFNIELDRNGKKMRAYKVVYDIPSDVIVKGKLPDNQWMKYRSKIKIHWLADICNLYKEDHILVGWQYVKMNTGKIEKYFIERKEDEIITVPQSDITISPIFNRIPGTDKRFLEQAEQMSIDLDNNNNTEQQTGKVIKNISSSALDL